MANQIEAKVLAKLPRAWAKIGIPSVLRSYPSATKNSVAGTTILGTALNTAVTITPLLAYKKYLVDGETIKQGDCWCVLRADDGVVQAAVGEPTTAMLIVNDGKVWKIVDVAIHSAGTLPAAWELQLRGSA